MKESRLEKLAPLSGVVGVVLFFAAPAFYNLYDYHPAASKVQAFMSANAGRMYIGAYLGMLAAVFLLWFFGSLYRTLRKYEGGDGRLSMIAFAGGVGASVGVLLACTALASASELVQSPGGIEPVEAALLNLAYGDTLVAVTGFSMAVVMGATAVIALRTSMFPKWSGWLAVVLAFGLITPEGWIVLLFAMLWLLGVSIWIYRSEASVA